jgi:hypothetical protein
MAGAVSRVGCIGLFGGDAAPMKREARKHHDLRLSRQLGTKSRPTRYPQLFSFVRAALGSGNDPGMYKRNDSGLTNSSDLPARTEFVIKEFDVPLVRVSG